ncbi:MAG: GNAT family N-acetyltransferase [Clostridia bacterium]|nr:GNAT family N-acetyltransferase [Clostridia bacterium]
MRTIKPRSLRGRRISWRSIPSFECGSEIGAEHWNRGYASEALFSAIDALFEMGYTYLKSGYFEENAASRRVMEECGMKPAEEEETLEYRGKTHRCFFMAIEKQ